ncbi:hypothetical protein [Flavobacterium marginilacus]|uniref:hypothetical protein n=1 Tax=Flavobacterium marginilacus TaxID=3003256 RepID=UPI00248D8452|nr:hypothetical protein [Flavobacterium marginilacus]
MKQFIIAVTLFFFFTSCSKDNDENTNTADSYLGKWTLIKMSGTVFNSETTGNAMEYQEFYVFSDNGTFTKIRNKNTVQTTAAGTYIVKNIQEGTYLELTYSASSEIIGSCYGNLKEELHFSDKNTLSSTWRICDGPGLDYQKIIIY